MAKATAQVAISSQNEYPDTVYQDFFTGQTVPWVGYTAAQGSTDYRTEGWYLGATYRFTDWFELGAYYSEYYPNRNDKDGSTPDALGRYVDPKSRAWNKDLCLTTRFDINENWVVKLEAHTIDGVALLPLPSAMRTTLAAIWRQRTRSGRRPRTLARRRATSSSV